MKLDAIKKTIRFLADRELSKHSYSRETFSSKYDRIGKTLENFTGNDFPENLVVNMFYSNLKKESLPIEDYIDIDYFVETISYYPQFQIDFKRKYKPQIDAIAESLIESTKVNFIKNREEIFSYVISESLIEHSFTKKRFIPRKIENQASFSTMTFFNEFHSLQNEASLLPLLNNKPFGFYICRVPYQKVIGVTKSRDGFILVSNQSDGITVFNFNNKVLGVFGLQGNSYTLENIVNKEHSVEIKSNSVESHSITLFDQSNDSDFAKLNIINQLVIKFFVSLVSKDLQENVIQNENKAIAFISEEKVEEKSLMPVVSELAHGNIPHFTKEELKFTGKYEFFSIFDKVFDNVLDMDLVNFHRESRDCFYDLSLIEKFNQKIVGKDGIFDISPKAIKSYIVVDEIEYGQGYVGIEKSLTHLNPITSIIGTEEEVYDHCKMIAKMNKLTLINFYAGIYSARYKDGLKRELQEFFVANIDKLLEDKKFWSFIKTFGLYGATSRNYYNAAMCGAGFLISKQASTLSNFNGKLLDYRQKSKAAKLLGFTIENHKVFEYLEKEHGLILSEPSKNLMEFKKAYQLKKKMFKELDIPNKKSKNFYAFLKNDVDIELNNWLDASIGIHAVLPFTAGQHKKFNEFLLEVNNGEDIVQVITNRYTGAFRHYEK
tara:strand:+ start:10143 stop:12125 length:1983 start_codon:yes stop_codon:yes gene_type:complete